MDHHSHMKAMPGMDNTTMPMMDMNSTMDMDHSGHTDSGHEMHMTFYFGVQNVPILFEAWTVNSVGGMVGACIAVCIVAMLYEGLKVLRETLLKRSIARGKTTAFTNGHDGHYVGPKHTLKQSMCSASHWIQTLLHLIQVTVSYALMLIFMSYNGYLVIAIVVGAGLGYFFFGWKKAVIVDINEHCH